MARTSPESVNFSAISAPTPTFPLTGGTYTIIVTAGKWGGGSVTFERDTATGFVEAAAPLTANGHRIAELPAGQYRFAVDRATGVYASVDRLVDRT